MELQTETTFTSIIKAIIFQWQTVLFETLLLEIEMAYIKNSVYSQTQPQGTLERAWQYDAWSQLDQSLSPIQQAG